MFSPSLRNNLQLKTKLLRRKGIKLQSLAVTSCVTRAYLEVTLWILHNK